MIKQFFSCDWGSSMFRLKLVNTEELSVLAEVKNNSGILVTHELWKNSKQDESNRLEFYLNIIQQQIDLIEQQQKSSFKDVPLVISGMASSNLGMIELPYQQLPLDTNGKNIQPHKVQDQKFQALCIIIPGVCTNIDVMRGEETILIGSADLSDHEDGLYIFPGTHSKHVIVENGKAIDFRTYMTGEFFDLLSSKSILSNSVKPNDFFEKHLDSFENGVRTGVDEKILHSSFLVRTNSLFSKYSPEQNYFYLSGLLIGSELSELKSKGYEKIKLVSNKHLMKYYSHALQTINSKLKIELIDADLALIKGQLKVLELC